MMHPQRIYPHPVILTKEPVEGKRPGDTFRHGRDHYRVIQIYRGPNGGRVVTESVYGREVWF